MVRRHVQIAAMLAVMACGPAPASQPPRSEPLSLPRSPTPCERAAAERARVPGLFADGKLDRALRVLDHADALCPASARDSLAPRLRALAEIGRDDEARALSTRIDAMADATPAMREATATAHALLASPRERGCAALQGKARSARQAGDLAESQRCFDRALVACEREGGAKVALETRRPALDDGASTSPAFAISADGLSLALGRTPLAVVDLHAAPTVRLFPGIERVGAVALSIDGGRVAAADDRRVRLWDARSGLALASTELDPDAARPAPIAISFFAGALLARGAGPLHRLDGRTLATLGAIASRETRVPAFALSASGRIVVVEEAGVRVLDEKGAELASFAGERSDAVDLSPDGARLAVASGVYDVASRKKLLDGPLPLARFAPVGDRVAFAATARDVVVVLDPARPATRRSLSIAPAHATGLAFRGDDRALAIATDDGRVLLWTATGLWPGGEERPSATLGLARDRAAMWIAAPGGAVELVGDAADALSCRFGDLVTRFDVCAERFVVPGLATRLLAGQRVEDAP